MTRGIWDDPQRYLETYWSRFPGMWYHGDWASVDEDGHWFLHGRADESMNVAGRKVGPAEVEEAMMQHPGVAEAAVIGVPDESQGRGDCRLRRGQTRRAGGRRPRCRGPWWRCSVRRSVRGKSWWWRSCRKRRAEKSCADCFARNISAKSWAIFRRWQIPARCNHRWDNLFYFTIAEDLPANSSTQVGKMPRNSVPSAGSSSAMRRPPVKGSHLPWLRRARACTSPPGCAGSSTPPRRCSAGRARSARPGAIPARL